MVCSRSYVSIWCELITLCITHIQARSTHIEVKDKSLNDSLIYFWGEYFHSLLVFIILYKQVGKNEVKAVFCNLVVVEIISIIYAISNLTVGKLFNLSYWRLFCHLTSCFTWRHQWILLYSFSSHCYFSVSILCNVLLLQYNVNTLSGE